MGVANSGKQCVAIPSHIFRHRCDFPIREAERQGNVNQEKGPGDDAGPDLFRKLHCSERDLEGARDTVSPTAAAGGVEGRALGNRLATC